MAAAQRDTSLGIVRSLHGINRAMKRRAQAQHGDSLALLVVLSAVAAPGGTRASDLAEQLLVDLSSVSRRLSTLEARGLVEKVVDASDRRAHLIALTDDGRDLLDSLRRNAGDRMSSVLAGWAPHEVELLGTLLARLESDLSADLSAAETGPGTSSPAMSEG